ncbi:MAG: hypothetical protein IJP99_09010, partial [Methanobrevibacter sp.]|nr:hypothetical protein [Methanobrevibacter sp.]
MLVLCIGTVSAETPSDSAVMNSTTDTPASVPENTGGAETLLGASNDESILSSDAGTFTELNELIQNGGNNIILDKNYIFSEGSDDEFINAIVISTDDLTIDGNNNVLDGNNMARIFQITGNNVLLKNIIFKNGNTNSTSDRGGAIAFYGINNTVDGCYFYNNTVALHGGAIAFYGINNTVDHCYFYNNTASLGGAITATGGDSTRFVDLKNSVFSDNIATTNGGAFYSYTYSVSSTNCTFINNKATYSGSTLFGYYTVNAIDSKFINNTAGASGTVVLNNGTIDNCTFINNTAVDGSVLRSSTYNHVDNQTIKFINSKVEGNVVSDSGGIINPSAGNDQGLNKNFIMYNVNMTDNTGVAVRVPAGVSNNLSNINIRNNTGIGITTDGNNVTIQNVNITNNVGNAIVIKGNGNITGVNISNTVNATPVVIEGTDVTFTDSLVDEGKAQTILEMYYAGNDIVAVHLTGYGTGGVYASQPETLNMTNVRVWNGKEYVTISLENTSEIDLINEPITITVIDENNVLVAEYHDISNENGLVYLDISKMGNSRIRFIATFDGDEHYFSSEDELSLGIGGDFYLLEKLIKDNVANGEYDIYLDRNYTYTIGLDTGMIHIYDDNVTIHGNGHTINGLSKSRIFDVQANNITMEDINFINGLRAIGGGSSSTITSTSLFSGINIFNCNFTNNHQQYDGAVLLYIDNVVVENCTFLNNSADGYSGIFTSSGVNTTLNNCIFINNTATSIIALWGSSGNYIINNLNTTSNQGVGDLIWVGGNVKANLYLNNSNFINENSNIVYVYGISYDLYVDNCTFINLSGRAINRQSSTGNLVLTNSKFINLTSTGEGGAVYWKSSASTLPDSKIENCSFINCYASSHTGALRLFTTHGITLKNLLFVNNSAPNTGAMIAYGNHILIDNITCINNTALTGTTGAVRLYGNNQTVQNSYFINNTAANSGGAIYSDNGNYKFFYNCTFDNNFAANSGALRGTASYLIIDGCNFTNNKANEYGAVTLTGRGTSVSNSNFINNSALTGVVGALYISVRDTSFTYNNIKYELPRANCTFINNTAVNNGIVFIHSNYGGTITNYTFINNTVSRNGGALVTFNNVNSWINVADSNFINNTADYGSAIYRYGTSYLYLNNVNLTTNRAGSVFTITTNGTNVTGHLTGNDGYLNAIYSVTGRNLRLQNVSYWNGTDYITQTDDITIVTEENKVTPLVNTNVSVIGFNTSETFLNIFKVTDSNANVSYDYNDGNDYTGSRLMFYFDGNDYYYDSGDSGIILGYGDFYLLQKYIEDAISNGNSTIVLDRNYTYTIGIDTVTDGINISADNVIIDGDNHTIDAKFMSRIFNVFGDNVILRNINFVNGNYSTESGAIAWKGADGTVSNCNFTNNTAMYGSIVWDGDNGKLINSNFKYNTMIHSGTVCWNGANGTVSNCNFINNSAGTLAGALTFYINASGNVSNCNFINNTAQTGGAVYLYSNEYANVILSNCNFINNTAQYGGALDAYDDSIVSNCNFTNNTAQYGGAIHWTVSNGTLVNSTFVNNTASNKGGAIYYDATFILTVDNCTFISNNATVDGGAVYVNNAAKESIINNSRFISNKAVTAAGGAVFTYHGNTVIYLDIKDSTFINNSAMTNAGAVVIGAGTESNMDNLLFENNSGNNILYLCAGNHNVSLSSSRFVDNNASQGRDIFIGNNVLVNLTKNTATNLIYDNGVILTPTNVIILENSTKYASLNRTVTITAVILDDNSNIIQLDNFNFVLENGTVISTTFDQDTGIYTGSYTFDNFGTYIINTTESDHLSNCTVLTGTIIVIEPAPITVIVNDINYTDVAGVNITLGELHFNIAKEGNVSVTIVGENNYTANYTISLNDFNQLYYISPVTDPVSGNNITVPMGLNYILNITNLNSGDYSVFVEFTGNDQAGPSANNTTFTVNKINPNIIIDVDDIVYGDNATVNVTVPANATGNITIRISGKTYNITEFNISDLNAGIYDVIVVYSGDNNYNSNITFGNFTVLPVNSTLT